MFKPRLRMGRNGSLLRKLAGVILAVAGIALIADKIPPVLWWIIFGAGMVFAGWKLFTG